MKTSINEYKIPIKYTSLLHNMLIEIKTKDGNTQSGYFKKFVAGGKGNAKYSDDI